MKITIEKDNLDEFIVFFDKNKVKVQDYEEDSGNNPLHLTVKANRYEMVEYLLDKMHGLEKEDKNFDGDTALMLAVLYSDLKMVKLLVEKGEVDINCKESEGFTPFMAACANGKVDIVEYLMKNRNCKINSKNIQGQTAIHRAAFYGEVKVISTLLKNPNNPKLSLTSRDSRGNTCLHFAAMRLNMTCFRYILKKLGDQKSTEMAKKNQEGLTPIQVLIKSFNLIKKDDRVITETEVQEYIDNKNNPPQYLYESLKEQKPNLFNKLETQKDQLIQKPGSQPLLSKQQMPTENNQEHPSKKNIQTVENVQQQEQEMQSFHPSQMQDITKMHEQQQQPIKEIDVNEVNKNFGLKSPIQGDSVNLFGSGAANSQFKSNDDGETNELNPDNRAKEILQRRKHNFSKVNLKPINPLTKKNV